MKTVSERLHLSFIEWQSRKAAARIMKLNPDSILEVAAGCGLLSYELRRLRSKCFPIVCTDIAPQSGDILMADVEKLPFENDSFDVVVCSNALEHFNDAGSALREMRRVSKRLWISWTPWFSPYGGHEFSPFHYFGMREGRMHQCGRNLHVTTVGETISMLADSGWKLLDIYPRYFPRLRFLAQNKFTREWATWNVELIATR